ncbi:hypothetical protein E2320_003543, partial [Naja naja]
RIQLLEDFFFAADMLFLLIFSSNIYPANTLKCHADPFLVPYEWYHPGDILIGGMTSQIIYIFNEQLFDEYPTQKLFNIPKLFPFLFVMNIVTQDIGREEWKGKNSAAMTVFHVQKERFQTRW